MRINKAVLLATSLVFSIANAEVLEFPKAGFTINSLDTSPTTGMSQPLQMFLPAKNGFASNVNVQIQPYPGTLTQYKELSIGQFKQMGISIVSFEESANSISFEYTGMMQGLSLHWYAKAFKKGNYVYLVTATGNEKDWAADKQVLMENVNSFKLK
ncbi:hypothetical protein KO525_16525 [Psychrosphaera sp. B3R10]|uniref:hypothetical protein n=1 Tax=unclassified Psychrosphaera TaxID=2641570 RepID=UPI001C097D51|nr:MULTISPECIES: hypothetical protein [unclassified Psychrosphaera]MBU2883819.1 hypothetical protein [Psychrosphaera sp. I2R16]MBU2990993.1 hypothetical protein [Psychrosphaera sp. B3R10]MDO6719072.1 hypothetical protein [Psychrosphaera sp. 1_MG-2023]